MKPHRKMMSLVVVLIMGLFSSCYAPPSPSKNGAPTPLSNEELSEKIETIDALAVQGDDALALQKLREITGQYQLTVEQQRGIYIIMGMLYEKTGKHDDMIMYYRKAYWLDPEGQDAWMLRETILNYGYQLEEDAQ